MGNTALTGPTGAQVDGVVRGALRFDGVDDRVDVPHSANLNQVFGTNTVFTLEAWAFPRVWSGDNTIMGKATAGDWSNTTAGIWVWQGFHCVMGSNVGGNPAGSFIQVHHSPPLNNWHHIVCAANGTNLIMYINGREVGRTAIALLTHPRSTNTAPLVFGRRTVAHGPSFNGNIDEIRVYNEALRAGEVQMRYAQGLKGLLARGMISQEEFDRRMNELQLTDN